MSAGEWGLVSAGEWGLVSSTRALWQGLAALKGGLIGLPARQSCRPCVALHLPLPRWQLQASKAVWQPCWHEARVYMSLSGVCCCVLIAGRVQSVALRLVCEREDAVQLFKPDEYWTLQADFTPSSSSSASSSTGSSASSSSSSGGPGSVALPAQLVEVDGQRLAKMGVQTQQQAYELVHRLWQQQPQQQQPSHQPPQPSQAPVWYTVRSMLKKPLRRSPPPPLVTSTLQQEAARRLGFSASKTMQVAQQLYEGANTGEGPWQQQQQLILLHL